MHFAATSRRRAGAFTLIELLTVIAIVGVLAAILVPTVSGVRRTARNSQCASNVRQWGQAIQLYAQDNKGYYTADKWAAATNNQENWQDGTNPYTRYFDNASTQDNIRLCPLEETIVANHVSYAIAQPRLNATGPADGTVAPKAAIPLRRATAPSHLLLLLDRSGSGTDTFSRLSDLSTLVRPLFQSPATSRHGGGSVNAAFGDGHVAKVTWSAGPPNSLVTNGDQWTRLN